MYTFRIKTSNVSNKHSYSKENFWIWYDYTNNSKQEIDDITKIVKSLEQSGLPLKVVSETIENEVKEQKCRFLGMLGTLDVTLLETMLAGKRIIKGDDGVIWASEGEQGKIFSAASSFN